MKQQITGIWPLGLACLAALIALFLLGWANMVGRTEFLGIAESREIIINSENPVEIESVHVLEGQSVERGQLLVQLRNPELTLKINQIAHQLDQYRAQNDVDKTELQSRLTQLEAEKNALINDTKYQIQELQNEYDLNMSLTSELKSISVRNLTRKSAKADHPTLQKIERLSQEMASAVKLYDVRIELQKKAIEAADKPLSIRINQFEKELVMLKAESSKLSIFAPISGMIGSVNFKAGEKVTPFAAVMTLHSRTPTIIKGYLREDEFSMVRVDDALTVHSTTDSRSYVDGTVIGVGSRIVEYPVRLRKHQSVQSWGREITIKIPETNNLILGEKVMVSLEKTGESSWGRIKAYFALPETIAGTVFKGQKTEPESLMAPVTIVRPITSLDAHDLEASAMVYLPELKQYLVAADQTPGQHLILYLMDVSGQVTREIIIDGIEKIDDIESMTRSEDGTIYLAASLSAKKNRSYPLARRLLVAIRHDNENGFYLKDSVDLSTILLQAATDHNKGPWAGFITDAVEKGELDMEGMFYRSNALFLGFKSPLFMKRSIIVKILNADRLFEHRQIDADQVAIWQMLSLKSQDKGLDIQERISDLLYVGGTLFITGVVDKKNRSYFTGSLWRLDTEDGSLKQITRFRDIKPEGIATAADAADLMICFDQGHKRQSQIALIKGVR